MAKNASFNRYMVECEFTLSHRAMEVTRVLIDTWWNVNQVKEQVEKPAQKVLIDTWWNVNLNFACLT